MISCIIAYMLSRVRQILGQFGGFDTDDAERRSEDLMPAKSYLERVRQAAARRPMSPGAGGRSPGRRRGLSFSQFRTELRRRTLSGPRTPSPSVVRALVRGRSGPHPADVKRKRTPRWGAAAAPAAESVLSSAA